MKQSRGRSLFVPVLMMLVAIPTLIGLGIWQWQRLAEKQVQIARIEERASAEPKSINLTDILAKKTSADTLDYTPVKLRGVFLHETEVTVFTNLAEPKGKLGGPGYDILTLFAVDGGGLILVDRGFVPPERRAVATRMSGQIQGNVEIAGFLRRPERRSYLDNPDRPERGEFSIRDPKAILALRASPSVRDKYQPVADAFYLAQNTPLPEGGLPQAGETRLFIPNNHLQYALTWWSLALVFAVMFGLFLRQRLKQD